MSEFIKNESGKADIISTIEGEKWQNAKEHAFNKLAKNVAIKGFRKGQAPKNLLKKYISDGEVLLNACEDLAQETLISAIDEHKVDLIARPELKIDEINEDKCVMRFSCQIKPDVNLGEYKGLGFKVEDIEVSKEEIDEEINRLLERKADLELKEDGEVKEGDTVVIDFEGFKDGVAFDGGKGENFDLEIGSHRFVPGFEEQLVGMKSEEEKDINITFPEDYQAEELKGQDVIFKVKVHEIKQKVLPELNEEFIKELKLPEVSNEEELRNYHKAKIEDRKKIEATNKATDELLDKLVNSCEIDIPEVMIDNELNNMVYEYDNRLKAQGLSIDQLLKMTNQTIDQFKEQQKESANKKVKMNLILEQIAKNENLEPNEEEIDKEYNTLASMYGMSAEEIKPMIDSEAIKYDLMLSKALDFVKNN